MRVVLLVAALFAVSAVVDVSARRIHKMKAALEAAEEVEAEATLPFDGDYWTAVKPDASKALAAEAKKPQLSTSDLLTKFFAPENIQLATQQGAPVVAQIGTFSATGILKQCNEGTCDDKWTDFPMNTPNAYRGGEGTVWLSCINPADATKAQCDLTIYFNNKGSVLASCANIGGATKKCSNPRPERWSTGAGVWMTNDVIINTAAPNSAVAEVYITKDALTVNWRFFGNDSNRKLTFTGIFLSSAPWAAYKPVTSEPQPAAAAELVKASKSGVLTTAQLLAKFFTSDNIQLAQMQGTTVPVRTTIGAYSASAITRSCNTGVCGKWGPYDMMTPNSFRGGEGSIVLACSVPTDLTKAQCDLTFYFNGKGSVLMTCPNVGAPGAKCSNARPERWSTGAGVWMSNDFITTTAEAAEVFFTNDQLAVHFRWRGIDSNRQLVFSDFVALSTPLTDYGVPAKTNCLSKTTADAVIAAAAAKKGLKSAIVLQKDPVAALIKAAPYKTVEDAVAAIKGIGPRNVVYVSFMWNFQC